PRQPARLLLRILDHEGIHGPERARHPLTGPSARGRGRSGRRRRRREGPRCRGRRTARRRCGRRCSGSHGRGCRRRGGAWGGRRRGAGRGGGGGGGGGGAGGGGGGGGGGGRGGGGGGPRWGPRTGAWQASAVARAQAWVERAAQGAREVAPAAEERPRGRSPRTQPPWPRLRMHSRETRCYTPHSVRARRRPGPWPGPRDPPSRTMARSRASNV